MSLMDSFETEEEKEEVESIDQRAEQGSSSVAEKKM